MRRGSGVCERASRHLLEVYVNCGHDRLRSGAPPLPAELLESIRQYETCAIADAIEHCGVRLRNDGFTRPGLRCLTDGSPHSIGYAATYRVRSSRPPITGGCYADRADLGRRRKPFPRRGSR